MFRREGSEKDGDAACVARRAGCGYDVHEDESGTQAILVRKETIERSFAEAKENHGLRTARMLGIQNMREQSFLTAAVQNMKRLAKFCFTWFAPSQFRIVNGHFHATAENARLLMV